MRHYPSVQTGLQAMFRHLLPLSDAQAGRVSALCEALMLAGAVQLTRIARFLPQRSQQDSRVRWITRLLDAPFLSAPHLYSPFLNHVLQGVTDPIWHLVIDRTSLEDGRTDLATISLNYRKHAIPLVWCLVPFGGAPLSRYVALLRQCVPLVPAHTPVIFHGDTEFGRAAMIRALREYGWEFILAQPSNVQVRRTAQAAFAPLASLPVTRTRRVELARIELFADQRLAGLNLLAFYQPHHSRGQRKREIAYLVTSLPLTPQLRRLGRRRWGTEPFYRDYKSSGWHLTEAHLQQPNRLAGLLLLLALVYTWTVCCGRWLCKVGRRHEVDAKAKRQRHLSIFRLGWDWLIHQWCCHDPIPIVLRLYS